MHLGEVVPGVDVHDREGELAGPEGLHGQVQEHRRVLAAAEEEDRALRLGGHLAQHEDGVRLEEVEVVGRGGPADRRVPARGGRLRGRR